MLCVLAVLLVAAMMLGICAEVILRMFGFPLDYRTDRTDRICAVHLDLLRRALSP